MWYCWNCHNEPVSLYLWQCQKLCLLSLAFLIDRRNVRNIKVDFATCPLSIHMSNFLPDIIALHKLKNIPTEEVISKKVSSIIRRQQPTQYIVIKYLPVVVIKYVPPLLKALFVPSDLSTCQHMWWKESISDKKPAQKISPHPSFPWIAHFF